MSGCPQFPMWMLRAIRIACRIAWPYVLTPWRSPLVRWRMETYGVRDERGRLLHAEDITPACFAAFLSRHHRPLWRYLRWAAHLHSSP